MPSRLCARREAVGFPVVMKILSDDIAHKTEIGGVLLDLADATAVRQGFGTLMDRARTACPDAKLDGVLVAPMVRGGVETIIGVQRDPIFGPMVMFGLGGVSVELFRDVAFASAPLSADRAAALVQSRSGKPASGRLARCAGAGQGGADRHALRGLGPRRGAAGHREHRDSIPSW
jgi:hypothetical protein